MQNAVALLHKFSSREHLKVVILNTISIIQKDFTQSSHCSLARVKSFSLRGVTDVTETLASGDESVKLLRFAKAEHDLHIVFTQPLLMPVVHAIGCLLGWKCWHTTQNFMSCFRAKDTLGRRPAGPHGGFRSKCLRADIWFAMRRLLHSIMKYG